MQELLPPFFIHKVPSVPAHPAAGAALDIFEHEKVGPDDLPKVDGAKNFVNHLGGGAKSHAA